MPCVYLKQPPLLGGMAGGCRGISGAEKSCQSFQVYTDVQTLVPSISGVMRQHLEDN